LSDMSIQILFSLSHFRSSTSHLYPKLDQDPQWILCRGRVIWKMA
jgi:hypothetical protein